MPGELLRFEQLTGGYGDTTVLRGVSGSVAAARCLGVLGRNGVGKSTLLRLLTGGLTPFSGRATWQGGDLAGLPMFRRNRLGISYAPQESVVFDDLSVLDNLTLHRASRSIDGYARYFEAFPRLRERLRQRAGTLSGGEKKLLSFVRVLAERKPLAILDEPTEGVQQENIAHMAELVRARKAEGGAFVIVEQNLWFLEAVMDSVLVLDHGQAVAQGPADSFGRERLEAFMQV